jgi:hypothetical protein
MYATKSHIHIGHHTNTSTEMQTQQILCSYSAELHKNFGLSAKSHVSAVSLMAHSVLFSSIKPHHDSQALSLFKRQHPAPSDGGWRCAQWRQQW